MPKPQPRKVNKVVSPKLPITQHPVQEHAVGIRDVVHAHLAEVGIKDLVLKEIRLGPSAGDSCPQGQHQEMVCRTLPDGTSVCRLECVPD